MGLKFYTSVAKGLKLKVRKFWGQISTIVEVTRKKVVGGPFASPPSLIGLRPLKKHQESNFRNFIYQYHLECYHRL